MYWRNDSTGLPSVLNSGRQSTLASRRIILMYLLKEEMNLHPSARSQQCFSEILQEAGASVDHSGNEEDIYLSEPLIEFHGGEHSLTWWAINKLLAKLARRYLSAPPTSVPLESLFSVAGDLYNEKRNRLSPEHAEELLFIKSNFHFKI